MLDFITIGSSTIDAELYLDNNAKNAKIQNNNLSFPLGEKVLVDNVHFSTGGGSINPAYAIKNLGYKVGVITCIGNDGNGELILNELDKSNIKFLGHNSKFYTNYSVIIDGRFKDRVILVNKSSSKYLDYSRLMKNKEKPLSKWYYIATVTGKSFQTTKKLVNYAKSNNIKIAFNPTNYLAERGHNYLKDILKNTNLLVLNKIEAILLLGKLLEENDNNIKKVNNVKKVAKINRINRTNKTENTNKIDKTEKLERSKKLNSRNVKIEELVMKLGKLIKKERKEGIVLVTDGLEGSYCYNGEYLHHIKPRKIKVLVQAGAGDCFCSTFLGVFHKKNNIELALQMAQHNVESVLKSKGTHNGCLSWNELLKRVKNKKFKINKKRLKVK